MDKAILDQIVQKLESQKKTLEKELSAFSTRKKGKKEDYDAQFPNMGDTLDDNAHEVAEYENNLSLERTLEKSLDDVVKALDNIKAGKYGMCKYCKKPIDQKRLLARPESTSCIDCKNKLQSRPKIAV